MAYQIDSGCQALWLTSIEGSWIILNKMVFAFSIKCYITSENRSREYRI